MAHSPSLLGLLVFLAYIASAQGGEKPLAECDSGASLIQNDRQESKTAAVLKEDEDPSAAVEEDHLVKKAMAEMIAMTLFVIIGCGSAMGIAKEEGSAWVLQVSLTFGLAITVLAYTIGHYSGGQINCAVTFGLVLTQQVSVMQGLANLGAQLLGSVLGALILSVMYPKEKDCTGNFGSNGVGKDWKPHNALVGEVVGTFLLMYTVLETAVNPATAANRSLACIAIGFAVFLAHSILIPIDGCSINPTRSFGPAVLGKLINGENTFVDMWIFWVGPLLGSGLAAAVYTLMAN